MRTEPTSASRSRRTSDVDAVDQDRDGVGVALMSTVMMAPVGEEVVVAPATLAMLEPFAAVNGRDRFPAV